MSAKSSKREQSHHRIVEAASRAVRRHGYAGVGVAEVNLVWDPPWDPSRMSEDAQLALNMF